MDDFGTQQPVALLKLLLDQEGMYDRKKKLGFKIIKDLGYIAAMGKTGGGRNKVDPRLLSLFSVFNIPPPAAESVHLIYASIIKGHTAVSVIPTEDTRVHVTFINTTQNVFSPLRKPFKRCVRQSQSAL